MSGSTSVDRASLATAAALAAKVASQKSPIEMYRHVLLSVDSESASLRACDDTLSIALPIGIDPKGKNVKRVSVDAKKFSEVVSRLSSERVTLSIGDKAISVTGGGASVRLPFLPGNNYPSPIGPSTAPFHLPSDLLVKAIRSVTYAAQVDTSDLVRASIRIIAKDGTVELHATTGHCISVARAKVGDGTPDFVTAISRRAAEVVATAAENDDKPYVPVAVDERVVSIGRVTCATVTAAPVPWRQIETNADGAVVSCDELSEAAERAGMFVYAADPAIRLQFAGGKLAVSSISDREGSARTELTYEGGRDETVHLSWRYLRDTLATMPTEKVELHLGNHPRPLTLRPHGDTGVIEHVRLIAPMSK